MTAWTSPRPVTRAIGRSAIREELARVAFGQFCSTGFEAGHARRPRRRRRGVAQHLPALLRQQGGGGPLRLRPAGRGDGRGPGVPPRRRGGLGRAARALDPADAFFVREPAEGLAVLRLVEQTPALRTRLRDKQAGWRPGLAQKLAERPGPATCPRWPSAPAWRLRWTAGPPRSSTGSPSKDGEGLGGLVDEAFGALPADGTDLGRTTAPLTGRPAGMKAGRSGVPPW